MTAGFFENTARARKEESRGPQGVPPSPSVITSHTALQELFRGV